MSEENVTTPETPADEVEAVDEVEAPQADEAVDSSDSSETATESETASESETEPEHDSEPSAPVVRVPAPGEVAQTVGRRKEAVVRVRLTPGSGQFLLNGKTLEEYFPNKVHQQLIREPLVTVEKPELFDVRANLRGGGITGQAGALRLAIARALIELDSEDRPPLKKAGFLTRDPRVKERKKYGLKKARKAPQYSKR